MGRADLSMWGDPSGCNWTALHHFEQAFIAFAHDDDRYRRPEGKGLFVHDRYKKTYNHTSD
jgi:hypothetical protein